MDENVYAYRNISGESYHAQLTKNPSYHHWKTYFFLEATFRRFVIRYSKTRVKRVYHRNAEKNRFNREVRYVVSLKNAII